MSHKKFGPDRFSRFDVYWIQTDRQTNKETDKPNLYIDIQGYPQRKRFKRRLYETSVFRLFPYIYKEWLNLFLGKIIKKPNTILYSKQTSLNLELVTFKGRLYSIILCW